MTPDMIPTTFCASIEAGREIPTGFAHLAAWSEEQLGARLEELTQTARVRRREADARGNMFWSLGGADIHYMDPEERAEAHALKLAMPSTAEQVFAARQRIAARVAARKQNRAIQAP